MFVSGPWSDDCSPAELIAIVLAPALGHEGGAIARAHVGEVPRARRVPTGVPVGWSCVLALWGPSPLGHARRWEQSRAMEDLRYAVSHSLGEGLGHHDPLGHLLAPMKRRIDSEVGAEAFRRDPEMIRHFISVL